MAKTVTIYIPITGYKKFKVRLWVGTFLIQLGIRILGINGKVEIKE